MLFWGERDPEASRANLRLALHRLPPEAMARLAIARDSVGVAADAAIDCDLDRFDALARPDDPASLEQATALYRDHLLKDVDAEATPEFDDWLHAQRIGWEQRAQAVFDRLIALRTSAASRDTARASAEREAALAAANRWVALMPGAEAAHRWLIRLLLDLGRRDAAVAQYELCQRFLAVAHGRPPTAETRALLDGGAAHIAAVAEAQSHGVHERATGAPSLDRAAVPATTFVGRLEELAELERLIEDPAARLITLHGMGGSGKTRLAHAFASKIVARFADGVLWVPLESAQSADALPAAIAAALGRELPSRGDRAMAVGAMLAQQERLVVLDNLESLLVLDGAAPDAEPRNAILAILEAAKRVRILVTSREVLGLQEEWVYELGGLPYATNGPGVPAPAIDLFAQRARQAYVGLSLDAELPHVRRICGLVEGLPLGIEIAAAWVRTIPCGEIAGAIEREAMTLKSAHRNRPQRHRSLDAVINYSWNLLSDEHRQALANLGLFVGGFTREAATHVAMAPLRTLSALVDKALVRRGSAGRYDLHELVRQFALARLRGQRSREAAATRRYIAFHCDYLVDVYERSRGPDELAANVAFRADLPNFLSCLRRSLDGGRVDALERMGPPLVSLLHTHGLLREALSVAEETTRALEGRARDEAMAQVRLQWGRAAITGGRPDVAREQLERACESTRHAAPGLAARSLYFRSAFLYQQGDIAAAQRDADEAMRLAAGSGDQELWCMCFNQNGSLASMHARFDVAEDYLRKGLAAARAQGTPSLIAMLLCGLAVPLYYQDRLSEAAELTREAADLSERLRKTPNAVFARNNLAVLELTMGNVDAARREAQTALRLARDGAHENSLAACLATLGEIELAAGRLAEARDACEEALAVATAVGNALQKTHGLYVLVRVALAESDRGSAQRTLLAFRDELVRHRLTVRIPMLIVATARVALASADAAVRARGWLAAVTQAQDVDATMRKEARALLDGAELPDRPTLADAEADAGRYVDMLAASIAA